MGDGGLAASTQMYDASSNTIKHSYGGAESTPKSSATIKKSSSKIAKKK